MWHSINMYRRIGVFDSGLGGLTVLKPLLTYYPAEYIYVADTVNLPYGNKTVDQIEALSSRIISFMIGKHVDACIIACHTVCATAFSSLEKKYTAFPLMGVIDLVCEQANKATKNGKIGIIGTHATINTHRHKNILFEANPLFTVTEQACPRIVPAIEFHYDNKQLLKSILIEDLTIFNDKDIDVLILGSTHYAIIKPIIREILGPSVALIGADETIAAPFKPTTYKQSIVDCYVTSDPEEFIKKSNNLLNLDLGTVSFLTIP